MNWGGGRRKYADGKDNEPVGVMDKTCRRNFASVAHLKERVLRSSLCFMGTRRLTGFAPAPSRPSKPPIKKEKSCFLSEGYTGREGRMGGKGRNTLQDGSQQKVIEDKLQLTSRSGQGATAPSAEIFSLGRSREPLLLPFCSLLPSDRAPVVNAPLCTLPGHGVVLTGCTLWASFAALPSRSLRSASEPCN